MMQPRPWEIIAGAASLLGTHTARSSPSTMCSTCAQSIAMNGAMMKSRTAVALSTSVSIGPRAAVTSSSIRCTCSLSPTSPCTASARPPAASMVATTSRAAASL